MTIDPTADRTTGPGPDGEIGPADGSALADPLLAEIEALERSGGSLSGLASSVTDLGRAIALADGRLPDDTVALARQIVHKAVGRLRHGTNHTLVALLGATGGGKSSLANALMGADVALTGVRRPTTDSTLACHWGPDNPHALLDWLGVRNRHQVAAEPGLDGLVLLDVPDHDSIQISHRLEMERMAEHADLLLWVTDPEKYGDAAMHGYLGVLRRHGAVMAVVLNKKDLLQPDELGHCVADLRLLLHDVELAEVPVLTASAATDPPAVDEVVALLAHAVHSRRTMIERLRADLAHGAAEMLVDLGPVPPDLAIDDRVGADLALDLVGASGLEPVLGAVEAGHRRDAAALTGWPFTRWLQHLRPHPLRRFRLQEGTAGRSSRPQPAGLHRTRAEGAVRQAVASASDGLPEPWPEALAAAVAVDHDVLTDRLDRAVSAATRDVGQRRRRWWHVVNVVQLILAAATIAGALWLGLLAGAAYLRLPDIPTPQVGPLAVPTALLLGGVALGLLLALLSRRLASVGARRRSRAVLREATARAREVGDELVISPMADELARRHRLHALLAELAPPA